MNDEMMERPQQRASAAFSSHAPSAAHRFDALRRKDEILAMVAHELRGPLTPMQLAIHLIRRASADRPEVLRSIDMLDRQITQISRLAEDLMDATRIDRGVLRVSKVSVDVVAVLAAPLTAVALAAGQRGQTLTVQIADRALRIEGDPVRLAQAVNNLLHNAVKYTPENGCIAVNVLADGKDLVVSVKDNGLGISGALLPHIFELFAQSSRTIAASAGGLGVGLAVVKAVAESHGGTVSATSAGPGTGSEFTLRLPILLERRMAHEPA
ncbi:HAMP domain-containing histidine kinase [Burkholderia sp. R-69927]|uniref:sensor histidine kinase n=1 Tax=Paraburkholderia domus TaxID=2793075 RepID=UPI0019129B5B|nr:HAMP domain-containing sensor histidine kinase [Paraburkholderia domus]MBK5089927.1 HAMP domain-containing histidine kinase [Burkholderia sp. R-69927]